MDNTSRLYHIGFILEQALGHITHTRNLQTCVTQDPSVQPHWALVPWEARGWAARVPLYKSNWTVRAGLRARRLLAGLARQTRFDALFFHTQVPAILATDWIRRIPSVVSLDATPLQYDELGLAYGHSAGPPWLEQLKWRQNVACFQAARHLVTWSHWAKQGLIEGYGVSPGKVTVIPPGVDTSAWANPQGARPARGPDEPVKVLFVGGNLERKGGTQLLEAFRALRPGGMELHLVTRDSVPVEPGLFVYNDMQPNSAALKQLYWQSDAFCLPTLGDCLPMALAEAGAAGLPLVSTRVAAIPEIVREGDTGLLVTPGDVLTLTTALRSLIEQPALRQQLGERAAQVVRQEFDALRSTLSLLGLLKQVAREGGEHKHA
jgi:glycosyltransferase involved in cell wall biosynthesis